MSAMALVSALGSSIGKSLVEEIVDDLKGDLIKGLAEYGRLRIAIELGIFQNIVNYAYDMLSDAEPHPVTGVSANGLTEAVTRFMESAVLSSAITSEDLSEEFFGEMIQEAFSNAVQYNIGGAVQTLGNIWKGAYPINPDEIYDVITNVDLVDENTKLLLMAMAGANLIASAYYFAKGYDDYVDKELSRIAEKLMLISHRIDDTALMELDMLREYAERSIVWSYTVYEEFVHKLYNELENAYNRAIARLHELLADAYVIKSYYDANILSDASMKRQAVLIELERQSIMDAVLEVENQIAEIVNNAESYLTFRDQLRTYARYLLSRYSYELAKSVEAIRQLDDQFMDEYNDIMRAYEKMIAYRMYRFGKTRIDKPVDGIYEPPESTTPTQPEEPSVTTSTTTTGE